MKRRCCMKGAGGKEGYKKIAAVQNNGRKKGKFQQGRKAI